MEPANFHVDSIQCSQEEIDHISDQDYSHKLTLDRDPLIMEKKLVLPSQWIDHYQIHNHPESFISFAPGYEDSIAELKIELDIR